MISVIVPVYNVEEWLPRCLDSIVRQSFADMEVLLIDDGSTDSSGYICDDYASHDSRIRVFHKENGGVSSARNVGLREAKGDSVCFIDADDCVHPRYIEIMYGAFVAEEADIVICNCERTKQYPSEFVSVEDVRARQINYADFANYTICKYDCVWAKMYRAGIIKNHLFDETIVFAEDALFNFSLIYSQDCLKMMKVDLPLYIYLDRTDSAVNTLTRDRGLAEIEWYLHHWDGFLKQYEWVVCEHAMKTILQIRMQLYLTPAYENVLRQWPSLSGSLINKMREIDNAPLIQKTMYYAFLKCFQLYRLVMIFNDPTIIRFEREKRNAVQK